MLWQSRQISVGKSSGSAVPQILQYRGICFSIILRWDTVLVQDANQ
jgi:hypothetical protein